MAAIRVRSRTPETDEPARRRPSPYPRPAEAPLEQDARGPGRRGFLGWVLAAPTLMAGAAVVVAGGVDSEPAGASIPGIPEPSDLYDLSDLLNDAALPTSGLVTVTVNTDGTVSYALPRAEVGQGLTTAVAMIIADELDVPIESVHVTLSDARPELLWNQITGGSNSVHSLYTPLRTAAALARNRLVAAAAAQWNVSASTLTTSAGVVKGAGGKTATYGSLATAAATTRTTTQLVTLKAATEQAVVGGAQRRIDALAAVTGRKKFAMDLDVPDALPTMICRPPMINGKVQSVANMASVRAMPGITDVGVVSTGVAVRGHTFGQCIDAVRALQVTWIGGTVNAESDATVLAKLKKAEIPLVVPKCAAARQDRRGRLHVLLPQQLAARDELRRRRRPSRWRRDLGQPEEPDRHPADDRPEARPAAEPGQGACHAGRRLVRAAPVQRRRVRGRGSLEAVRQAGQADVAPHRRLPARPHPPDVHVAGAGHGARRDTSSPTSSGTPAWPPTSRTASARSSPRWRAKLPGGNLTFAESIFDLTANVTYNFGVTTQLLNEIFNYDDFNTASMRNVYSPDVCTAQELIIDQMAKVVGKNPYTFRQAFVKDARMKAVLTRLAEVGNWGRAMPAGTAQGIALHPEYKAASARSSRSTARPRP